IIPSEEVKLARENRNRYFIVDIPYQYDMEERMYVENADGKQLKYEKYKNIVNGVKFWYEGSEEDFPLRFHLPTLTGTNTENYSFVLPLPEDGGVITKNLPRFDFAYGTVEIVHVARENGEYDNRDTINPEISPAAVVDIVYRVTPKEGQRQMYSVKLDYLGNGWYGSEGLDAADDAYTAGTRLYLKDLESKEVELKFHMPSFWILGDYDITIEKPAYGESNASAIDEESDEKGGHFSIEF
ncbi:MAG: hypothetical protein IJM95_05515, partial [Anaerotignum sp.]|nr:hypothetical protein [Anaerotignum sp.]